MLLLQSVGAGPDTDSDHRIGGEQGDWDAKANDFGGDGGEDWIKPTNVWED